MSSQHQWANNLTEYDSNSYSPLLGISDERSAAQLIAYVAHASSKMIAINDNDVNKTGIIIDGERMTSAGEAPIGLDEYRIICEAARSKTNCTTNVGVRLNARYYQQYPEVLLSEYVKDKNVFLENVLKIFEPFNKDPNKPRPLKLRINVDVDVADSKNSLILMISEIDEFRSANRIGNKGVHSLTLFFEIKDMIYKVKHFDILIGLINLANVVGLDELCIDGNIIEYGRRRLSSNGLLNIIEADFLRDMLQIAKEKKINLRYKYNIDLESASRTVWTGLYTARSFGLNAAKYGLVPLIFEEQKIVISNIQEWMPDWTAIPAFYVDTPLLSKEALYYDDTIKTGLLKWLEMVSELGVKTALIDCPDRIVRRRLLKLDNDDKVGVLSMKDVPEILEHAKKLNVKILWSGGITYTQAYEFGKLKVFGIFTTSTTAKPIAVGNILINDPVLPFEMEPTEKGIKLVHSLLQAGFLVSNLENNFKDKIESSTKALLQLIQPKGIDGISDECVDSYMKLLTEGWRKFLKLESF